MKRIHRRKSNKVREKERIENKNNKENKHEKKIYKELGKYVKRKITRVLSGAWGKAYMSVQISHREICGCFDIC
jgi:hypothetical protein